MIDMALYNDHATFTLAPWQALLAIRHRIEVPYAQVQSVSAQPRRLLLRPYLRMPGTHVLWLLAAGTFVGATQREFWWVTRRPTALVVDLINHEFTRLVLELNDPDLAVQQLGQAVASTPLSAETHGGQRLSSGWIASSISSSRSKQNI